MKSITFKIFLPFLFVLLIFSCDSKKQTDGPYFGNGFHNGWADQNFIVTCHDYWRKDTTGDHKIYSVMQQLFPDFYVHTGDVEYYDKPEPYALTEEIMRFKWDRLFVLPLQRNFWANTTSYFMKDDHDVGKDDAYPGMTYGTVSWERGLEIFNEEQFPSHDKFYKIIRWGKDLQIWIVCLNCIRKLNRN